MGETVRNEAQGMEAIETLRRIRDLCADVNITEIASQIETQSLVEWLFLWHDEMQKTLAHLEREIIFK